jgi:hypothetical protein
MRRLLKYLLIAIAVVDLVVLLLFVFEIVRILVDPSARAYPRRLLQVCVRPRRVARGGPKRPGRDARIWAVMGSNQ